MSDNEEIIEKPEKPEKSEIPPKNEVKKVHLKSNVKVPDFPPPERQNWLIHMHYIQKDYEVCELLIKEQLSETGFSCEYALYVLGLICRQKGRLQESLNHFQQCVLLNGGKSICNFNQVAKTLFIMGRIESAILVYQDALKLSSPGNWEIPHNLGLCYMQIGKLDDAKQHFQSAIQACKNEHSHLMLGKIAVIFNQYEEAAQHLEAAAELTSDNPDILSTLGLLYKDSGESNRAFEKLGSALSIDSCHVEAVVAAATIIQQHGDCDVALTKYRVAAANAAENSQIWNNIGMAFFSKKKYVAAISCLSRAFYLTPFEWKISYNLGLIYCHTQQYASAFRFLSSTVQLIRNYQQQNQAQSPTKSATAVATTTTVTQSIIQMTSTIASSVSDILCSSYTLLGICLMYLDDSENAQQAFFEAMKLTETGNPLLQYNYAVYLYKAKQYREVGKYVKKVFNFDNSANKADENDSNQYLEVVKASKQLEALINVGTININNRDKVVESPPTTDPSLHDLIGSEQDQSQHLESSDLIGSEQEHQSQHCETPDVIAEEATKQIHKDYDEV